MVVVAKIKVKSGEEKKVEKAFIEMVSKVSQEEGTLVYTLHRSMSDPTQFLFYEKYTDPDALSFHSSTPYFKALFEELGSSFDGPAEIEMYSELAGI